jgi:amino acid transporter
VGEIVAAQPSEAVSARSGLKPNAIGFWPVLMQAITHIAPAAGILLTIQFIASEAGKAAPLAYAIAFVIILTLGISLTQLAKFLPSAGGYYTYVSRTIGPRSGFLTSWFYFLYDPIGPAIEFAFMGYIFNATLQAEWGASFPWWLFFLLAVGLITVLVYRGIKLTGRALVILGLSETAIIVALALSGIIHPGSGGLNASGFNPGAASSGNGFFLAIVFAIFAFTGFESVAPIAEESVNPRKTLPRAIIVSIIVMGVFFILSAWGIMAGWGTNHVASLINSSVNPFFVVGKRLWGVAWVIVFLALVNSAIGTSMANMVASTRVFYGMARSGSLPSRLAEIHPRFRTPTKAIWLQTVITLAVGLGLGFGLTPVNEFDLMGVVITLTLIFVYGAGNIGVIRYYWRERRSEFNPVLHAVFPIFSTIALIYVGYKSIVPLPASPVNAAPFIVAGWLILGLALVWGMSRTGQEDWLRRARQTMPDDSPLPEPAMGAKRDTA